MSTLTLAGAEYLAARLDYKAAKARKHGEAGIALTFAEVADLLAILRPELADDQPAWMATSPTMLPGGGS